MVASTGIARGLGKGYPLTKNPESGNESRPSRRKGVSGAGTRYSGGCGPWGGYARVVEWARCVFRDRE
jgi:hypothetical protein